MRLQRTLVTGVTALSLIAGVVACGTGDEDEYATASVVEDCDVEDQRNREDDCGYWQSADGASQRFGDQPDATWFWVWWAWVQVGRMSYAPAGWKTPPHLTVKAPTRTVRVPRKSCALGAADIPVSLIDARIAPPPPARAPNPPPRFNPPPRVNPPAGGGNVRPNPPARPQPPVYKPPTGRKIAC